MNISDIAAERRAIERLVGTAGIRVEWLPPYDQQPRTDMVQKVVYLPAPLPTWTPHEYKMLRAFTWHEVGHHHESQNAFVDMLNAEGLGMSGEFGAVLNMLDDVWQEQITSRKYIGPSDDLSYCQAYYCGEATRAVSEGKDVDRSALSKLGLCYKARSEWQDLVRVAFNPYESHTDLSWGSHLIPRINGIIDHPNPAYELLAIAREMIDSDPESKQSSSEAEEENKQATARAKQDGNQSEEGEGTEGEGNVEEGEGDDSNGGVVSYKDLMSHHHDSEGGNPQGGLKIIYDHDPAFDYDPYPLESIETGYASESSYAHTNCYESSILDRLEKDKSNINTLRRVFQTASQTKRQHQRKRGKLSTKHLPRVMQGDDRLFYRKVDKVDNTADVYLLVDGSGSMAGPEYILAAQAAITLSVSLESANINNKVVVFNDYGVCCHLTIKDWSDRSDIREMAKQFGSVNLSSNSDGDNILQVLREFSKRSCRRKVLLVLSDGQPASYRLGDCYTFTQKAVEKCSHAGVECYGIGINDSSVKTIYPEHTVIKSLDDLLPKLIDIVKQKIIKEK